MVLYPEHGHFLPGAKIRQESLNFLRETIPSSCSENT
jgi:hypothetical protein